MADSDNTEIVNFTIDGIAVRAPKGTTVFAAATKLGIDIPIFCYQERMPPFGACRVCLVEVEKMPRLQTSCTLLVTEGMIVKTQSAMAAEGRKEILELLLINHPLDCPICDRGGECPLQDQVLKFGPGKSRFYEEKRRFKKPIPLGPVLMLDRERCIVCARCTRFSDLVSGDNALEFFDRGFRTEVGTPDGGTAESKFIGNTIMLCPVGALTSQVYRFRARPWDNEPTASTCTLCPVGCSLIFDSRDGEVMRTRSQENRDVNDIWLCDKGWFGYEFSSSEKRLQTPLVRREGKLQPASWDEALRIIADKISEARSNGKLAALGGNPLTIEENFLFQRLMREGAGVNNIDHRVGMPIIESNKEGIASGMEISIGECEALDFAVLLGTDLTEEFPVIWLRLKQAINCGAKVIFIGHFSPEIAHHLSKVVVHSPGKEIEILREHSHQIAALAQAGKRGAIFVGSQYLSHMHRSSILSEVVKIQKSMPDTSLNLLEGRNNSIGARLAGMRPDLGPLNSRINKPGLNALQMMETGSKEGWDFLYVAGANPALKMPADMWNKMREKLGFLVVQDLFLTATAQQADVVLPTLSYVEKEGSFINIEHRIQRLLPGKEIPEALLSDGDIFRLLAEKLDMPLAIDDSFMKALEQERLSSAKIESIQDEKEPSKGNPEKLSATFASVLFDHGVRMNHNTKLVQMAKEPFIRLHPAEGIKRGIKNGDRLQISSNGKSVYGKAKLDKRVSEGTVVLPLGFPEIPVYELGMNLLNGLEVDVALG